VSEKTKVWDALFAYFPEIADCGIAPDTINAEQNAMTMAQAMHSSFGAFEVCLDAQVS
jgi:hypothetical protein